MTDRFYKAVKIAAQQDGYAVYLDSFALKTPAKNPIVLPSKALAELVQAEWESVDGKIDTMKMPMNRLVNTALDRVPGNLDGLAQEFVAYANHDLTCYRAEHPERLVELQEEIWGKWLKWCGMRFDVSFTVARGIEPVDQPDDTLERLKHVYLQDKDNVLRMGGLSHATALLGSAVLALAVEQKELSAEAAFMAAFLDEQFQIDQWGEDGEAAQRLQNRRNEIDEIVKYFGVLG
ncbi:MAG: ATP12 family chaperone protein [Parvibaculales bacterium]